MSARSRAGNPLYTFPFRLTGLTATLVRVVDGDACPFVLIVRDELVVQGMVLINVLIRNIFEQHRQAQTEVPHADRTHFRVRGRADIDRLNGLHFAEKISCVIRARLDIGVGRLWGEFEKYGVN